MTKLMAAVAVLFLVTPQDELLKELPKSKLSLIDGIRQLTKGDEVALSGKFELENGKLSLSVYTAEKGLGADAEHNVLKEFAGDPTGAAWKPESEVFKDVEHVSRSATQATLMSLTKVTLADVLAKASKDQAGTAYSINPKLVNRKAVFVVLVADGGKTVELAYDLMTGDRAK